ncbi:cysteine-rich with EGF-like domain protein 2 [Ctenocephalides felis]|uniref:cysteine-rich with EGF-like domain protein 2 n=1 Tax=Ctenocephalides felis TaxID=7515 RepID=UPI000E6E24EA|nr:cysteine-rich with EGF-like domain protein 2 [Ctenocephalides felis]
MKIIWLFIFLSSSTFAIENKNEKKAIKLAPCQSCRTLVDSFKKGMDRTSRGKYEGGDAAWEEQKLGSYMTSEIRLVEIQEKLCNDVDRGQDQCHTLAETNEGLIEEWWFKHQENDFNLHQWLCIDRLKVCCPIEHFGPECLPCEGYPKVCNGNGQCKGNGTRLGNGKCICDKGYSGDICAHCADGFYESYKDDEKLLCSQCHAACKGPCTSGGVKGCKDCNKGWFMNKDGGCMDINECVEVKNPCKVNEFCVNNEGSFSCLSCDKACKGCSGDGPDMCEKCAEGYELKDNICVDVSSQERSTYVSITRYLTYFGLCVATCIVLQSSTTLAALFGLAVAIYISVSEYMLKTNKGTTPQIDPNSIDWQSLLKSS